MVCFSFTYFIISWRICQTAFHEKQTKENRKCSMTTCFFTHSQWHFFRWFNLYVLVGDCWRPKSVKKKINNSSAFAVLTPILGKNWSDNKVVKVKNTPANLLHCLFACAYASHHWQSCPQAPIPGKGRAPRCNNAPARIEPTTSGTWSMTLRNNLSHGTMPRTTEFCWRGKRQK